MKIVWDERKRLSNLAKHGLDFEMVVDFDWDRALIGAAHRSRHGHQRMKATGLLSERTVVIIFSVLGSEAISIVSVRAANSRERTELEWSRSTPH